MENQAMVAFTSYREPAGGAALIVTVRFRPVEETR